MPLYEYQCDACGHRFEKIQKYSDPLVDTCPICAGTVRKLMSSPAIQFKGSGFYITDYGKKDQGSDRSDGGSADKGDKGGDKGEKTTKSESSQGKADKTEKSAPPAASDKSASSSSGSSSSSSKESSSASPSKTST
jgi:putative FmdB family regulatory protein